MRGRGRDCTVENAATTRKAIKRVFIVLGGKEKKIEKDLHVIPTMTKDHQEDCFVKAIKTTGITGFAGLFVSALQNSMQKHSHGAKGVFTRTGGTITLLGN